MSDSEDQATLGQGDAAQFSCTATVWRVEGEGGWHFVTLPQAWNDDLRTARIPGAGFGSVRVRAAVEDAIWQTSVFPDSKRGAYLLPLKRTVRDRLGLGAGDEIRLHLTVLA